MKLLRLRAILTVLCAAVALLLSAATVTSAAAAVQPPAATVSGAAAAAQAAVAPALVMGAPKGCPSGAVCFYAEGNGGDLCGIWYDDPGNLPGCANIGPSGSIYNNGVACNGCDDVALYFGANGQGAWYCLQRGNYLLYIDKDHFNRGSGKPGYGQTLAYRPGLSGGPGGVASAYWTNC